jgi:chromosome segregation ATPase
MSTPPTAPPTDAERAVADLEYKGKRLGEELDGLRKHEAHLTAEIARHNAALDAANAALAALPADAGAGAVFAAKRPILAIEHNAAALEEQRADLQEELSELPKLIAVNTKAIADAKADLPATQGRLETRPLVGLETR